MDFFKSVLTNDPDPSSDPDPNSPHRSDPPGSDRVAPSAAAGAWSFGGLIKTLATRSESLIETYRRDLEEFRSGLQKETEVIRDVASRAVKDLPGSLEAGASAAQESLETVGQVIDDFGSSVWRGTTEIISQGKDAFQLANLDDDAVAEPPPNSAPAPVSKRYSRFEVQVMAIQNDPATFLEDPDDSEAFRRWCSGFDLASEKEEIERLCEENGALEAIHENLVSNSVDHETFWTRYFYRIHKLKVTEDARAKLVKCAIASDADEDLSWEVDDEDEEVAAAVPKYQDPDKQPEPQSQPVVSVAEVNEKKENVENSNKDSGRGDSGIAPVEELKPEVEKGIENSSSCDSAEKSKSEGSPAAEGKVESSESSKDSDFSVVQEEEDLGWDEIEDLGSSDQKKTSGTGSPNREQLRKRLSVGPEDEDLSWDIEDNDESDNKH